MAKILRINPDNPQERLIEEVVQCLKKGGVIIYPSDTVYGLGCDITNVKAMEKLAKIKEVKLEKHNFSIICNDLSHLSEFIKPIDNQIFRILKKYLPGPFTFILTASNSLPLAFKHKKTIGIRVPNHKVPQAIVEKLEHPIASTSTHNDDEILEYITDPELIAEKYDKLVDIVIDSGFGDNNASTIVDLSDNQPVIVRQGKGDFIH